MVERALLLLGLLGVGLFTSCAALVLHTWWGLTRPRRRGYAFAVARGLPGDPGEVDHPCEFCETKLGPAPGLPATTLWDIVGQSASGPVVVFSHGWGQSRHSVLPRLEALAPLSSRIIAWDLPGHGESPGPSALGATEAAALARIVRWASESESRPVVLYGYSLGAGVGLALASQSPELVSRVIAESPYRVAGTPAENVLAQRGLPRGWSLRLALRLMGRVGDGGFDRAKLAALVACPVLVLHGERDEIAPVADGRDIAGAAPRGSMVVVERGSHRSLWVDVAQRETCRGAIREFLTRS